MFRKLLDEGLAATTWTAVAARKRNWSGQVVCKPGSITPHTKFKPSVRVDQGRSGGTHRFSRV